MYVEIDKHLRDSRLVRVLGPLPDVAMAQVEKHASEAFMSNVHNMTQALDTARGLYWVYTGRSGKCSDRQLVDVLAPAVSAVRRWRIARQLRGLRSDIVIRLAMSETVPPASTIPSEGLDHQRLLVLYWEAARLLGSRIDRGLVLASAAATIKLAENVT